MKRSLFGLAAIVGISFSFQAAMAQDYQVEAGAEFAHEDTPSDSKISVGGTYYFNPVKTENRPLAEAAFLGHNDNVSAGFYTYDKAKRNAVGIGGEFWIDELYLSGELLREKFGHTHDTGYVAKAGYMIQNNLLAYGGIEDHEYADKVTLLAGGKYVGQIQEHLINVEGQVGLNDGDLLLQAKGDYFFNMALSAGVRAYENTASGGKFGLGAGTRYFFQDNISASLEYAFNKYGYKDNDVIAVGVQARF